MPATPAQRRYWKLLVAGLGLLLLLVGFLGGFFAAKTVGTSYLTRCYANQAGSPAPDELQEVPQQHTRGAPVEALKLRQLPPPGSEEAQQLLAAAGGTDTASELYTFYSDTESITEALTGAFLQQLHTHLVATGHNSTDKAELKLVISQFKELARDVLSYLRFQKSEALLLMLRQYAQTRTFNLADVDPDVLRAEVQNLLNLDALGRWYARVASKDQSGVTTRPVIGIQRSQATSELLQDSSRSTGAALQLSPRAGSDSDRRLLAIAGTAAASRAASVVAGAASAGAAHWRLQRRLRAAYGPARTLTAAAPAAAPAAAAAPPAPAAAAAAAAGAPIPSIPRDTAAAARVPPTVSPLMTLPDMLCEVQNYSPTKLQGLMLPDKNNRNATGTPIKCPPPPARTLFKWNSLVFKSVRIPVVFHCQRFMHKGVELPPMWKAEEAAANLIAVANKAFESAGIQFVLKEVRHDTKKYPYLLLSTLKDWQDCTGNPSQEGAGFPCLAQTASFDDVAALTNKYVINIIVGGSIFPAWCNRTEEETCSNLYAGYTGSIGPWFARPSPTWTETAPAENWITITWDEFSPMSRNSKRFWDGGGVTVAHELGHYLGLMHTHEGSAPCEGDGLTKADFVPDTPVNKQTIQWAATNGLAVQLSRWCTNFRNGKKPDTRELLVFNSCPQDLLAIDNVFNLLSYLPDQCCMMLSPNQIARMQWAIARFRPKMMAAYAIK